MKTPKHLSPFNCHALYKINRPPDAQGCESVAVYRRSGVRALRYTKYRVIKQLLAARDVHASCFSLFRYVESILKKYRTFLLIPCMCAWNRCRVPHGRATSGDLFRPIGKIIFALGVGQTSGRYCW